MSHTESANLTFSVNVPSSVIREWFDGLARVETAKSNENKDMLSIVNNLLTQFAFSDSKKKSKQCPLLTGKCVNLNLEDLNTDDVTKLLTQLAFSDTDKKSNQCPLSSCESIKVKSKDLTADNLPSLLTLLKNKSKECSNCSSKEPEKVVPVETPTQKYEEETVTPIEGDNNPLTMMMSKFNLPQEQLDETFKKFGSLLSPKNGDDSKSEQPKEFGDMFNMFGSMFEQLGNIKPSVDDEKTDDKEDGHIEECTVVDEITD